MILYFHGMPSSSPENSAPSACMGATLYRTGRRDEIATLTFFFDPDFLSCELMSCIFLKAAMEGDLTGKFGASRIT